MSGATNAEKSALSDVRRRRRAFHSALVDLEKALAAAAGRPAEWRQEVKSALVEFDDTLADHVEETEKPGGFFDDILVTAPRLGPSVRRLRDEHTRMRAEVSDLLAWCDKDEQEIEELRERALDLLRNAVQHRQRGSDLLYEAYEVDVSAGD
jgi:hypothetical protein